MNARERRVLQLVLEGHSNKKISETLKVCTRTVELRRASMMKKLDVSSLTELLQLFRKGRSLGLPPDDRRQTRERKLPDIFDTHPGQMIHLERRHNGRPFIF